MKPVPHGEPYAGKLHVRFDEGAGVPDNKGRPALLYTLESPILGDFRASTQMLKMEPLIIIIAIIILSLEGGFQEISYMKEGEFCYILR